jgi:aspartyl protease family protein
LGFRSVALTPTQDFGEKDSASLFPTPWRSVMLGTFIKIAAAVFLFALVAAQGLSRFGPGLRLGPGNTTRASSAASLPVAATPTRAALPVRRDEYRIPADPNGQFSTDAEINGARISRMLVDTGATLVALSYEDAAAAGVFPAPADYKYAVNTANGVAHVARVRLRDVRIGRLTVYDVDAVVGERGALSGSLLGMTFLSKLSKFEIDSGALVLRQ